MNLLATLTERSIRTPEKLALLSEEGKLTYRQLEEKINQTAHTFKQLGLQKGDRVLIQIGNRFEYYYCYFGAIKAGGIIVPVNPYYTASEISYIAQDCSPTIYVCEKHVAQNVETVKMCSEQLKCALVIDDDDPETNFQLIEQASTKFEDVQIDPEDVCEILYTSGTTGRPKGVMLTHKALYLNAVAYRDALQVNEHDIALIVIPLYHAAGQTNCMNTVITAGGTSYLLPKFDADKVLNTLVREKITFFVAVPTMFTYLLNHPHIESYPLSIRLPVTGAAPTPVEIHNRWKELFGKEIIEGYGLSESGPCVTIHRPDGKKKIGSVGPPLPEVKIKIVDDHGREVPDGEMGEVVVQSPSNMIGYWNKPDETKKTLVNNWLYTGDMGYVDDEGYLYIADRKKDIINRGGLKISPREIEEVLYRHPSILEASVIGVPDPVLGEELKAFITLKSKIEDVDRNELRRFCRQYLAPYKVPKHFEVIDEMPKTLSGKIQKEVLRTYVKK